MHVGCQAAPTSPQMQIVSMPEALRVQAIMNGAETDRYSRAWSDSYGCRYCVTAFDLCRGSSTFQPAGIEYTNAAVTLCFPKSHWWSSGDPILVREEAENLAFADRVDDLRRSAPGLAPRAYAGQG